MIWVIDWTGSRPTSYSGFPTQISVQNFGRFLRSVSSLSEIYRTTW